ncbi:unnamed protein product [Caretta caretta]
MKGNLCTDVVKKGDKTCKNLMYDSSGESSDYPRRVCLRSGPHSAKRGAHLGRDTACCKELTVETGKTREHFQPYSQRGTDVWRDRVRHSSHTHNVCGRVKHLTHTCWVATACPSTVLLSLKEQHFKLPVNNWVQNVSQRL